MPVADTTPQSDTGIGRTATTKTEQDLVEMVTVLRTFLRQATSTAWREHMEIHSKWSKSTFDRRLRIVKSRGWIRIVGDADADLQKVLEGSLFEATEIAPGAPVTPVSNRRQDIGTMNGAADAAAKAARELLERLDKGKPAA